MKDGADLVASKVVLMRDRDWEVSNPTLRFAAEPIADDAESRSLALYYASHNGSWSFVDEGSANFSTGAVLSCSGAGGLAPVPSIYGKG